MYVRLVVVHAWVHEVGRSNVSDQRSTVATRSRRTDGYDEVRVNDILCSRLATASVIREFLYRYRKWEDRLTVISHKLMRHGSSVWGGEHTLASEVGHMGRPLPIS